MIGRHFGEFRTHSTIGGGTAIPSTRAAPTWSGHLCGTFVNWSLDYVMADEVTSTNTFDI